MKEHYDICIAGFWYGWNYGSLLNGYAEYRILKDFGKEVLMLQKPNAIANDPEITQGHNTDFIKKYYDADDISPVFSYEDLNKLNNYCDCFCAGSDQIWNYKLSFYENMYLPFVNDNKKIISFATSFGHKNDLTPDEAKSRVRKYFSRFNAISVREKFDVDILKENYGINGTLVFEPVFCIDKKYYLELAENSDLDVSQPYILTYILDPTPEKRNAALFYAKKSGLKLINILDGDNSRSERIKKILNLPNSFTGIDVGSFIKAFMNASFVITDSFHGSAFSIIFNKPFISIGNPWRGLDRFNDLLTRLNLKERLVTDQNNIPLDEKYLSEIDYSKTNEIIESEKQRTVEWLRNVIETPKDKLPVIKIDEKKTLKQKNMLKASDVGKMHVDIRRCQMLAALLRDYGIRHVVISSGSRHTELVRFFEHNDCFVTHNVVDERSAGFYALGLAVKLNKPVAVCCTSGTAASNYLTSMSEAFYQHIPLIYITADRYPYLLNQREDQMVPQENMYGSVCLKSVTLMPKDTINVTNAVRRMICETIMEATHNQPGPVHINLPISFINEKPLPDDCYNLETVHFYKIRRYKLLPDRSTWNSVLEKLKVSNKIMIVYGQNHILTNDEKKSFDEFSRKFNCVFCTDNLSNYSGNKSVNSFNIIKPSRMTSNMLKELEPDIVITMFGANVTPFKSFILKSNKFFHWDISPSGKAADPYKKLTRIFECTPVGFVKRLNFMAGNITASDSYYQLWKKYEVLNDIIPENYSQKYATFKILEKMPETALLHLANSNTVRFACSYELKKDIEVYCNRGTNGIDGSASSFMGQVELCEKPCYLFIGDLSFFYDMNSLWNKKLKGNIRIALFNNFSAALIKSRNCSAITHAHHDVAEGWVKSLGFTYLSSKNKEEFDSNVEKFTSDEDTPMFFEIFC